MISALDAPEDRDQTIAASRAAANSVSNSNLDKELFSFKPKLNPKSNLIAQNLQSFAERREAYARRQSEIVKKIT